jgi:hypothetical protein
MRFPYRKIAVIATLALSLTACSEDSPTGNDDQAQLEAQFSAAADVTVEVSGYMETAATAYALANTVPGLAKSAAPTEILLACPNLSFDLQAKTFTLDYGSGCAGKDGKTRSGSITVQFSGKLSTGATLTLIYNNYKTSNKTFNGSVAATISNGNTVALVINNATVTDDKGTATINANLTMAVDLKGTPQNPDDDVYTISGSGTVAEGGKTYSFTITDPLVLQVGCSFPTSGKMAVSSGDGQPAAIDFFPDNGACDNVAVMTIGSVSKRITLGS